MTRAQGRDSWATKGKRPRELSLAYHSEAIVTRATEAVVTELEVVVRRKVRYTLTKPSLHSPPGYSRAEQSLPLVMKARGSIIRGDHSMCNNLSAALSALPDIPQARRRCTQSKPSLHSPPGYSRAEQSLPQVMKARCSIIWGDHSMCNNLSAALSALQDPTGEEALQSIKTIIALSPGVF
jgi:hypothetical protein